MIKAVPDFSIIQISGDTTELIRQPGNRRRFNIPEILNERLLIMQLQKYGTHEMINRRIEPPHRQSNEVDVDKTGLLPDEHLLAGKLVDQKPVTPFQDDPKHTSNQDGCYGLHFPWPEPESVDKIKNNDRHAPVWKGFKAEPVIGRLRINPAPVPGSNKIEFVLEKFQQPQQRSDHYDLPGDIF